MGVDIQELKREYARTFRRRRIIRMGLRILPGVLVVVLLAVVLRSAGRTEELVPAAAEPFGPEPSEVVAEAQTPYGTLAETGDMGPGYLDRLTFLGDSTTYGLRAYGLLADGQQTTQVWTPASGTLTLAQQGFATIVYPETGEEITIAEACGRSEPDILVITLGINGVSFMDEAYFTAEYTALIESVREVSPGTAVIIQSIFPIESTYTVEGITRERIEAANGWLEDLAPRAGAYYLDTQSVLTDERGYLREAYGNGDGLHLNPDGYGAVLGYIRTHGITQEGGA